MSDFWTDMVESMAKYGLFGVAGDTAQATSQAVGGWNATGGVIAAIWTDLKDGRMWRSLGWLLLGIALIITGAVSWVWMQGGPVAIARRAVA